MRTLTQEIYHESCPDWYDERIDEILFCHNFLTKHPLKRVRDRLFREANNIVDFLTSAGYVQLKADSETSARDLYAIYKVWCEDNAENPLSPRSFSSFMAQNSNIYQLKPLTICISAAVSGVEVI